MLEGESVPAGIEPGEMLAGADDALSEAEFGELPEFDASNETVRPRRFIDEDDEDDDDTPMIARLGVHNLLVDSPDEQRLVVLRSDEQLDAGVADRAVVVLAGDIRALELQMEALEQSRPDLVILAMDGLDEDQFDLVASQASRAGVQVLEAGLALEC